MAHVPAFAQPFIVAILGLGYAAHRAPEGPDGAPVLKISGKARPMAAPSEFYAFTPTVYQSGDEKLRFEVQNKPSWMSFGIRRGTLYGTPKANDAGAYSNIIITVSDGKNTVQLPGFTVQVAVPAKSVVVARK